MDVKTIAIALPAGLVVIFATLFVSKFAVQSAAPVKRVEVAWEPQSRSAGEVMVEATPMDLVVGKAPKFALAFDTHSGSLDFDVAKVAVLTDSQGNVSSQATWDGSPPGGHHRKGTLVFTSVLANGGKVTLVIKEVSAKEGVEFNWVVAGR